jgi:hypothetical protein
MKQVKQFKMGFQTDSDYGNITLVFQDNTTHDLNGLSAEKFNALYNVLQNDPVYWNGTWLFTDNEIVHD